MNPLLAGIGLDTHIAPDGRDPLRPRKRAFLFGETAHPVMQIV